MSSDPKDTGKTDAPDSPRMSRQKYLDSENANSCIYMGTAYPHLSEVCMANDQNEHTIHLCINGVWVDMGEECTPEE